MSLRKKDKETWRFHEETNSPEDENNGNRGKEE
jgi:hypothetical protein